MDREGWRGQRYARGMIWAAGGLKFIAAICFVVMTEGNEVGCGFALLPMTCALLFIVTQKRGWGTAGTVIYALGKLIYVPLTLLLGVMNLVPLWAFPLHLSLAIGLALFFHYADQQAELLAGWKQEQQEQEQEQDKEE